MLAVGDCHPAFRTILEYRFKQHVFQVVRKSYPAMPNSAWLIRQTLQAVHPHWGAGVPAAAGGAGRRARQGGPVRGRQRGWHAAAARRQQHWPATARAGRPAEHHLCGTPRSCGLPCSSSTLTKWSCCPALFLRRVQAEGVECQCCVTRIIMARYRAGLQLYRPDGMLDVSPSRCGNTLSRHAPACAD